MNRGEPPPPARKPGAPPLPSAGTANALFTFETKLEKEEEILDAMLTAHAKGTLAHETWDRLHEAARRDERLSELAFAYESVSQGKRLKALAGTPVAEFLYQAARFFGDVFGDEFGAATYLERAIVAMPTHAASFEKLEAILAKAKNHKRIAELYADAATHRPRAEQLAYLRKAAELFDKAGGHEEKTIELFQHVLRLDPADESARNQLEARYVKANRLRDVARLLDQALSIDPPPTGRAARKIHARLLDLYANQLHEPERTIPHVEAILTEDPSDDEARKVAQKLIVIKGLAARAAAAMAKASGLVGTPVDVLRYLQIELDHTRGPKRRDVLLRVGILKQDRMNDEKGAFESFEQALALDAADDELRQRYAALATKLGKFLDAAKTLNRVGPTLKDPAQRAGTAASMGELLLAGGDAKRAKTTFASVVGMADAGPVATLIAARALAEIYEKEKDAKALADVLEKIGQVEPDPEAARLANERLAELATELGDTPRAIAAWQRLVSSSSRAKALAALEPLYEAANDVIALASILEERSMDAPTPGESRKMAFKAAEVRTSKGDPAAASAAWKRLVDKFGAARDVHALWIPLLEAQRDWAELAHALSAEAQLAPEAERAEVLARLGNVLLLRTKDVPGAVEAFRRALAIDPTDKASRATLEKLAATGEHRLLAAAVLEPIYRAEQNAPLLLKILDVKASLGETPDARLAALEEAVSLSGDSPSEQARASELAGRGLAEAVAHDRAALPWLERVERFAGAGTDPKRRALLLGKALGERDVTSTDLSALARAAGDAYAAAGDVANALSAYRRALAFEPGSSDLLGSVDDLLRDQGSPSERIALYRAALAQGPDAPRRKSLLHRIASIERHDLGDRGAAAVTYRAALEHDPDDVDAHTALAELHAEAGDWTSVFALLEERLSRTSGDDARRVRARLAEVAAAHGDPTRAREQCAALLAHDSPDSQGSQGSLAIEELESVARVADVLGDAELAREVLKRRADAAQDPREQIQWLERLGELECDRRNDLDAAAATWKRAAALAESAGDDELATQLYARVRKIAPDDEDAALRLSELCERAEKWPMLPMLYAVRLEHATSDADRATLHARLARVVGDKLGDAAEGAGHAARAFELAPRDKDVVLLFERLSIASGGVATFEGAVDDMLATSSSGGEEDAGYRGDLRLAKGRALATDPARHDDAASVYRSLLEDARLDETRRAAALSAFDALVLGNPSSAARQGDARWLYSWRAEHAHEGEKAQALLAWANAEELMFGDAARALDLHRKILALDPDNAAAMDAAARLAIALGDTTGALTALLARRDRSEGPAKSALDLQIATILLERTTRFDEALASVRAVLEATPSDEAALALATRLLAEPSTRDGTILMLDQACDGVEDIATRVAVLSRLLSAPADAAPPDARQRWYERLLDLHQERDELEPALLLVVRAATELPLVDGLWDRAEDLARRLRRPDEVAALYQGVLSQSLGQREALSIGERAVAFYEEWFEDSARVVTILERVLEIDPAAQWAFDRLKLLFDAAERWDDLFVLFDRALPAADREKKIELLEDAAQVAKDFAGRPDRAIGYLEQLLELKPTDARLSASLERLYERQGRHRELVQLLTARLPALQVKDAQRTRARIATLWIDELHEPASALVAVEEMMAIDPPPASDAEDGVDVSALLERILAAAPHHVEVLASSTRLSEPPKNKKGKHARHDSVAPQKRLSVRQRAAALLKDRYAEAGREGDLVRVLEVELEAVKSIKERIRRHHQIAGLHGELGNDAAAMDQYVALVTLEPDVATHRVRLAELAEKVGRFDRLADVLAAAADECNDDTLRVELLMQAGLVHADRIGDGDRAIDLFLRILEMNDVAKPAVIAAARRVEPLLEAAKRPTDRLSVLERIASIEPDEDARKRALATAARLATELGESERAIQAWQARLNDDAADLDALDGLVILLDREKRHGELIDVLEKRARADVPDDRKRADRVRIATIQSHELGAVDEAIAAWREVEAEFGESDESTTALATLLRSAQRWKDVAKLLARGAARAEAEGVRGAQSEFLRQLGDIERERLDASGDAIESYARALTADPHNVGATAGLHAVLPDEGHRAAAVIVLMKAYDATDAWKLVLELTPHRLLAAGDDTAKLEVLLHASSLSEQRAGDPAMAFEAMRRAFLLAPANERVQQELTRLAEAIEGWRSFVDAHREIIELHENDAANAADVALLTRLRFTMATAIERHLDDARAALAAYQRIVDDDGNAVDAALAVVRVGARLGRWDAVAQVLTDVAHASGAASASLFAATDESVTSPAAWDALTAALTSAIAERSDLAPHVARDLEAKIAAWHRDRRGDPDAAEIAFQRALVHDPAHAAILAELAQLQRRAKGRPLIDSLLRLSDATGGDLELLREAAELAMTSVGDRALAKSVLEKLFALGEKRWTAADESAEITMGSPVLPAPFVEWSVERLALLHEEEGDYARVLDLLRAAAELPFPKPTRRALRHRAARVAVEHVGDIERAVAIYDALFTEAPADEDAVARLVALYTAHDRTKDLLGLRERQIGFATTTECRIALRLEVAHLLVTLGDVDRAIVLLRESLAEAPRDNATVSDLTDVLDSRGRFAELCDLLREQAMLAEDAGDRAAAAELWMHAANVAEERLGDRESAAAHHLRVVALEPRPVSYDALARLATLRGQHAIAAEHLQKLRDVSEPSARSKVALRLADALIASGRDDLAEQCLEDASLADPAAEDIRARLSTTYRRKADWQKLARLLTVAAAHAPDKAARLARLREAASLFRHKCADPGEAVPLLEQACDLEPTDQGVRLLLADALGAAGRFEEARGILKTLIDAFGTRRPKERAPVHYQLAQLELAMGNRARALVELDSATRIDPANPEILRKLAELAREDGQLERAERSYRALLVVLRRQDETTDASIARSEVMLELSAIAARQGEAERAKEILESALESAAKSDFEASRLEDALRARGDFETLARALEAKLARSGDGPAALETLPVLAAVLANELGRVDDALPVQLRALAAAPASAETHETTLALARRAGAISRYVEAVQALVARAEASGDNALGCSLLLRLGGVLEDEDAGLARAAELYERALTLDVNLPEVLRALDRVYERLGDAEAQGRALKKRVELETKMGNAASASDALYRLAALRLSSKATLEEGCDILASALEDDPQLDRAEACLRRAVETDPRSVRVLELYEQVGRTPGHERALVDALTRKAELSGASAEAMREAIEVARALGDGALAESLLSRFLEGERTANQNVGFLAWAMETLSQLRESAGDLRQAVELRKSAASLAEPEESRRLSFEVARLAEGPLEDLALAAETYEALRTKDPADREAWEPLLDVYRRIGKSEELSDLLAAVVEYVDDSTERSRLRLERVKILTRDLGVGEEAAAPLREIVDEDPSQVEAAIMLANILERAGREDELADLLAKQLDAAKDRSDAASVGSLALRLGKLLETRDPVVARNVYYTGLDWDAQSKELLRALLRLFGTEADISDRADVSERLLALEEGPSAEELALKLNALRVEQWDDAAAERALELGYKAHPASFVLKQRLESAYRERKAWAKLAEMFVLDAGVRTDVGEKVAKLREAASLYHKELAAPADAARALDMALAAAPSEPGLLNELVVMLCDAGDAIGAEQKLTGAIERLDPEAYERAPMLAKRAAIKSSRDEHEGALSDLEQAYRLGRGEHAKELARELERVALLATQAADVPRERALRLRLVDVLPHAGDVELARTILADLVKQDPKDAEALRALASLESSAERWDAASAAYRRLVALEEGEAVGETALRLADACERANRLGDARGGLERARMMLPGNEALRHRLERLYESTGAYRELAEMFLSDAKATGDVAGRFAHLIRAGSLLLQHGGDAESAIAPLKEAQALRPSDNECIALLSDAYTAAGRTVEAAELLNAAVVSHKGRRSRELAALYHRLARVAEADGEAPAQVAWLTQSLDMDSQNGAVASELAVLAMDGGQLDLANRALRVVTMLKNAGPMSKALAYQYMGEIARKQGDNKRAVLLLKRAVQEDASLAGAKALLDILQHE